MTRLRTERAVALVVAASVRVGVCTSEQHKRVCVCPPITTQHQGAT